MSTPTLTVTAGGPRIAGLLGLAVERAQAELTGEVLPRHPQLRPAHLRVFRFGSIDGRRTTELAALAGMTKQSMHELVTHFERHGYLTREPDPTDDRARLLRLTDRGRQLERDVVGASARLHLDWERKLGSELFSALWAALQKLTGHEGPPPGPGDLRRRARAPEDADTAP